MKHPTLSIGLTDQEIIEGLRHRDSQLTRFYFYDTCRVAYHVCDKRYDLAHKPGLDFSASPTSITWRSISTTSTSWMTASPACRCARGWSMGSALCCSTA